MIGNEAGAVIRRPRESRLTRRPAFRIVTDIMQTIPRTLSLGLILLALPGLPGASAT